MEVANRAGLDLDPHAIAGHVCAKCSPGRTVLEDAQVESVAVEQVIDLEVSPRHVERQAEARDPCGVTKLSLKEAVR